jgi:hypothetical protein
MLKNIFRSGKKEDPSLTTLQSLIPKGSVISDFTKVLYLGGYGYPDQIKENLKKSILANDLKSFLKSIPYNKDENSMILYYVISSNGKSYIVSVYEPNELYEQNQIIDIIPCESQFINTLNTEVIYPT